MQDVCERQAALVCTASLGAPTSLAPSKAFHLQKQQNLVAICLVTLLSQLAASYAFDSLHLGLRKLANLPKWCPDLQGPYLVSR